MHPIDFVTKWRSATLKEKSGYQEHFIDLCHLIDHPTPAELDPTGISFTFEAGASKSSGGQGFADVWYKERFAWEYKGQHANLDKAYQQILQYREALHNPPLLVVCDFERILIHTNFTNTVKKVYTLTLDDLLTPQGLATLKAVFKNPEALKAVQTPDQVTEQAAAQFGEIARLLHKYGEAPESIAHFLIRLLFCLFAEDAGLLPAGLITNMLQRTRIRPDAFRAQLQQLFEAMSTGGWFGEHEILHFNGHLFDHAQALLLDTQSMDVLVGVSSLDWAQIKPSIFGTLFERSLDPAKRSQLGAHYTGEADILLIVEPVLMAPQRRRWELVRAEALALAAEREAAKGAAAKGAKRANIQKKLSALLLGFDAELSAVQVLDAACGSGNFLYIALRLLLDLEKEVIRFAAEIGLGAFFPTVSPAQLHGIEINPYAHQLAQATIWIGYIQWLRENGYGLPAAPVLKPLDNIQLMDAILAHDAEGKPVEPAWPAANVIIGNPPFLGGNKIRAELGDRYVEQLFSLYKDRVPAFADLVCYWFERAREMIEKGQTKRAGLLATQGIRGGVNRRVLERIKQTGDIFWAISDRDWILDGANVHVSMVGFDNGTQKGRSLDRQIVDNINADLTVNTNTTDAKPLFENSGICFMGPSAKGPFDISTEQAKHFLELRVNVNGRSNSDVVRHVASAVDLVQTSRNVWTIDFGLLDKESASLYEAPFEYVKEVVYPIRSQNRRAAYALKWWLYAEPRPGMRKALQDLHRYIATPGVAKHRIFVWMPPEVLCNQGTLVFARSDDYFFGVLHARPHELWSRRMGTQLREAESGFRYTPTSTFETYPFPWSPGKEPSEDPRLQVIALAAQELVQLRDAWLNPPGASPEELKKRTLTNLYNQRPTWLDNAHRKLDRAVFAAYGWEDNLSDEEILARLLALNLERAGVVA